MNPLRNRALERRLRRLVRREIRRVPQWKNAARRVGGGPSLSGIFLGLLIAVFLGVPLVHATDLQLAKGLLILLGTLPAVWLLSVYDTAMYGRVEQYVLARWPVAPRDLFAFGWRRFLKHSALAAMGYGLMAAVILAKHPLPGWAWVAGVLWLGLQWLMVVGFVLLLHDPRSPLPLLPQAGWRWALGWIHRLASFVLNAAYFLVIFGWLVAGLISATNKPSWGGFILQGAADLGNWLGLLLPWGWPATLLYEVGVRQNPFMLLLLIPMGGWVYLSLRAFRFLQENHQGPWEEEDPLVVALQGQPQADGEENAAGAGAAARPADTQALPLPHSLPSPHQGPAAFTSYVLQRKFLQHFSWSLAGWLERWVIRWFNPRLELILQMLLLGPPRWSAAWRNAWLVVLVTWVLALFGPPLRDWAVVIGIVGMAATAWPVFGGHWPALRPVFNFRSAYSFLSFYPVSLRELGRVVITCNGIRMLAAAPILLVFGGVMAGQFNYSAEVGVWLAAKVVLVGLALQPAVFVFRFAAVCGDDRRFPNLSKLGFALGFMVLAGLTVAVFLVPVWWLAVLLILLGHGASWGFYLLYRRRFERMQFDWVLTPNVSPEMEIG
ncbi:MAG: hypothetical protein N3J91_03270 [Verrucomicrobiae bacterium]|nr:hypothetical protein [Verrucomicrobiae bacterium]